MQEYSSREEERPAASEHQWPAASQQQWAHGSGQARHYNIMAEDNSPIASELRPRWRPEFGFQGFSPANMHEVLQRSAQAEVDDATHPVSSRACERNINVNVNININVLRQEQKQRQ